MRVRQLFNSVLLLVIVAFPLVAQDQAVRLTLEEARQLARAHHPSLRAARGRLEAAREKTVETRSLLLPQLRLSARAAYLSDVPEFTVPFLGPQPLFPSINRNYGGRISLQQNLFTGFRLSNSVEMARRNADAAQSEYTRDEADLMLTVTTAYWNLHRASRVHAVLGQTLEQVTAHLADARNFRQQGMATDYDVLKVETQLSEIKLRLLEAQSNLRLAQMTLNSLTGRPLDLRILPSTLPRTSDTLAVHALGFEEAQRAALDRRPELAAARERASMQEAAVAAARGGWYPQIVLSANYDYARPNQRVVPPKDAWEETWDVGIALQWNIWDWFSTSAQTAQAEANLSVAQASFSQLSDAIALETAQAYLKAREAYDRIKVATLGTRQAEEGFRITQEKYKQGLASNSDLLDAETALLQARLNETNANVDYLIQIERLKKATGESLE